MSTNDSLRGEGRKEGWTKREGEEKMKKNSTKKEEKKKIQEDKGVKRT